MPENFLIRTLGGPCHGEVRVAQGEAWPLPDVLMHPDGRYLKTRQSALDPLPPGSSMLMRGAEYQWVPGNGS